MRYRFTIDVEIDSDDVDTAAGELGIALQAQAEEPGPDDTGSWRLLEMHGDAIDGQFDAVLPLHVPDALLRPIGDEDQTETLLMTLALHVGDAQQLMHFECFALVESDEGYQTFSFSDERYDHLHHGFGADGRFLPITIGEREYAAFVSPFCD